ncbi:MAG TPA: ATP-binding protein [Polyangiaceae bacterium LLY-WYZ-15_(1-7)]|nr:ATP-binding protein [Polyangiaceae bacterium LLY-WYZ-15_(1-7)]
MDLVYQRCTAVGLQSRAKDFNTGKEISDEAQGAVADIAEMLAEGMVGEERRPRVHDELVSETHRLGRLVENVLEITRLEEGRRSLRRERLDLRARVRELLAAHAERVARAGFTLVSPEAGRTLPASVEPQALEQILVNLIDNALKYGGGAENEVAVRVGLREGEVFVEVSDRGPGVPEAEREKVLERFHRVEREETAHMPGTGIGLALVRELAWAHGGDVEVGEAPGGGCRVVVTLGPRA